MANYQLLKTLRFHPFDETFNFFYPRLVAYPSPLFASLATLLDFVVCCCCYFINLVPLDLLLNSVHPSTTPMYFMSLEHHDADYL